MVIERFGDPSQPATDPLDRQDVQDIVFNDRQQAGELWRDQLVTMCEGAPGGMLTGSGGPVDVSAACPVLEAWDLHENLDSTGAILFRRFATRALANPGGLPIGLPLPVGDITVFSNPFDYTDPVDTPSGLQTNSLKVRQALAEAVTDLQGVGIPLDAPLGDWQYEKRGAERIPIHGGPGDPNGAFNAIGATWHPDGPEPGYSDVPHGSSFVMVTQFTDDPACGADDRTILTYSQSENPNSPYFKDQTDMFSNKQWVNPAFCESEVQAQVGDPGWSTTPLAGCLPAGCGTGGGDPGGDPGGGDPGGSGTQGAAEAKRCFTVIRGTPRADRLAGTDQSERIRGRHGSDRINGAGGEDCLHGGSGDDRINSADGGPDRVRCGRGVDTVRSDPVDSLRGCEARR